MSNTPETADSVLSGLPEKIDIDAESALIRKKDLASLVLHNMREGYYYARALCRGDIPEREVYSAVYRALEHASRNFNPKNAAGLRFFAYAKVYVRGSLSKEWRARNVVKNAKHESIEVPKETTWQPDTSTDDGHVTGDTEHGGTPKWETTEHQEPEFAAIHFRERMEALKPILKSVLSEHERMIIELTYFADYNFEQIGRKLGVSRSAIQNSHTRALNKLRVAVARKPELFK